ncbi:MAG TPA: DUF3943 domain-containing protein [bacterium]|nr:DUF3943 domain-containing protein [bacterium]
MKINYSSPIRGGIVLFFLTVSQLNGQEPDLADGWKAPDTTKTKQIYSINQELLSASPPKNYLLAAVETVGVNMLVWSYDRYIKHEAWANISFQSFKNNLRHGFVWDSDGFATNQFFHPYSGALSFTSGRANGIGFWQSLIYSFSGSLMWELAMENEYPSANDIITTPSSGIVLGEISYRISSLFLDESAVGLDRAWRELTAALLCPMHGFNRLLKGNTWKAGPKPNRGNYSPVFSFGVNGVFLNNRFTEKQRFNFWKLNLEYGDVLATAKSSKPFDYFTLNAGLSYSRTNSIIEIYGTGMLWGKNLSMSFDRWSLIGIFKNFDILYNETYKISASSIGSGVMISSPISEKTRLNNIVILSGIILGGVNSIDTAIKNERDYNIGHGANGKIESTLSIINFGKFYFRFNGYWLHTFVGIVGDELIGIMTVGSQLKIIGPVSLAIEYINYDRHGEYVDYPSVRKNNFALRTYLSYEF